LSYRVSLNTGRWTVSATSILVACWENYSQGKVGFDGTLKVTFGSFKGTPECTPLFFPEDEVIMLPLPYEPIEAWK
jgi:hypothetical protein